MARIPLPDRGQPIDVTYIYQIANAVNDVSDRVSTAAYNYTSVKTRDAGTQNIKTSETKFVAGYVDVVNNETVTAGTTRPFSFDYPADFKYAPIATATVVNTGTSDIGNDVTVVLTSITTSKVEGLVRFGTSGNVSISVNFILIGVPN